MLLNSTPSPGASTVTSNVKSTLAPAATSTSVHVTTLPASLPPLLIAEIPEYPLGTTSSTEIPVASFGPSLETVTVNVITSPMFGSALLTVFTKLTSTAGLKPKSTVMLPLASSASSWSPPGADSSAPVGSSAPTRVITLDHTSAPDPSGCRPLSSPSTSSLGSSLVGSLLNGKSASGLTLT